MKIGRLELGSRLLAAPMAGVIDVSMRILLIAHGAGMVFSEMVSAEGIRRNQPGSTTLITCHPLEAPCAVQLFGRDPSALADAARFAQERGAALVDVNMGCPVRKVVRQGEGAALLREPDLCGRIIESVTRAIDLPVTAKIRAGWDASSINYREIGLRLADAGVDAVILHPRTAVQFFAGSADWSLVGDLASRLPVPVIGSGDVTGRDQAHERLAETGASFVMIGRAAMGRPWVFSSNGSDPGPRDLFSVVERHRRIIDEFYPPRKAASVLKRHCTYYVRGHVGAARARAALMGRETTADIMALMGRYLLGD
jgi:nifR3 family TIM-barrel protein